MGIFYAGTIFAEATGWTMAVGALILAANVHEVYRTARLYRMSVEGACWRAAKADVDRLVFEANMRAIFSPPPQPRDN